MFIVNLCVLTGRILRLIEWQKVALIVFHGLTAFAVGIYVAGEFLGNWVHRTNDRLAANWVKLIVPPTPAEGQAPIVVEEVSNTTLPIVVKVELRLPLALKPMEILFTTPLLLAAAQAPVALLAAGQPVAQQDPAPATNRRRRGRRAHANRK